MTSFALGFKLECEERLENRRARLLEFVLVNPLCLSALAIVTRLKLLKLCGVLSLSSLDVKRQVDRVTYNSI